MGARLALALRHLPCCQTAWPSGSMAQQCACLLMQQPSARTFLWLALQTRSGCSRSTRRRGHTSRRFGGTSTGARRSMAAAAWTCEARRRGRQCVWVGQVYRGSCAAQQCTKITCAVVQWQNCSECGVSSQNWRPGRAVGVGCHTGGPGKSRSPQRSPPTATPAGAPQWRSGCPAPRRWPPGPASRVGWARRRGGALPYGGARWGALQAARL